MQSNVDKLKIAAEAVVDSGTTNKTFVEVSDDPADEYSAYPVFLVYGRDMDMEQISEGARTFYEGEVEYGIWIVDAPKGSNGEGGSFARLDTLRSAFLAQASLQAGIGIKRFRSAQINMVIGGDECFVDRMKITIDDTFKAS